MTRARTSLLHAAGLALLLSTVCGCQTAGFRLLSFVGLQRKPVVVALVLDNKPVEAATGMLNPFPPYGPLRAALSEDLQRPVVVDACFPFQVRFGLESNWYNVAVLSPAQLAAEPTLLDTCPALAVPIDRHGQTLRSALLVVPKMSSVNSIPELRGKVVAFGPAEHSRGHYAALQLLQDAGLRKQDLSLEALPIPGSLKHMPDGLNIVQSLINGSSDAGFIDGADWEDLPESAAGDAPARDKLRVLAQTIPLPSRVILASPKLDEHTRREIVETLVSSAARHAAALEPLRIKGYAPFTDEMRAACKALRTFAEPAPPTQESSTQPAPPDEQPRSATAR